MGMTPPLPMRYFLTEIEATQPLQDISLGDQDAGIGILVRLQGRPVAFWLEPRPDGGVLTVARLVQGIEQHGSARTMPAARTGAGVGDARSQAPFPPLTIAICTKDRPECLARCLRSLAATLPASEIGAGIEILVVDNAPSDGRTRDVVAGFPKLRYVCEPLPGLDFARNRALKEARGALLAYLDDDVVVDALWLTGLREAWADHPDAAAFTGQVLPYELATEAQFLFENRGGFRKGFERIRYRPQEPDLPFYPCYAGCFGTGANMAFRTDVLRSLGGFDEALDTGRPLPGGGDLDMFYRVVRAGHALVYEPSYLVFHQHRQDMAAFRRQMGGWGSGAMAFWSKCYQTDPAQRRNLRRVMAHYFIDRAKALGRSILRYPAWLCLKSFSASLRRRHPTPPSIIGAELWGGITGLFGEYGRSQRRSAAIRRRFDLQGGKASALP